MKNQKSQDSFFKLKYIAYCLSQTPPEEAGFEFEDFLEYAKWTLCQERNVLMKDPIWETYSDEELLVEYYALVFTNNEEFKKEFEEKIGSDVSESLMDWFDTQIEKNKGELDSLITNTEDEIEFTPEDL